VRSDDGAAILRQRGDGRLDLGIQRVEFGQIGGGIGRDWIKNSIRTAMLSGGRSGRWPMT
jgi:hypothetical protein